ncbi:MAG TPA: MBL fold metallo-hydrolase [Phototrophicaceae bacterium]|nr:MBL fold metallo-hydrolase [Phototrophicaceae bacterium]
MIDQIQWLGHGSFVILGDPLIYINPRRVARVARPADAILIGSDHYEYCSQADIAKLRGPNTQVIVSAQAAKHVENSTVLRPWQSISVGRACIKGIPAYTPHLGSPDEGGLGFVISVNFFDIYYAGHTGIIPEMASLRPDIAILPIDGSGTMSASEAAQVVAQMRPKWVIPCNWGFSISGTNRVDAQIFAREVGDHAQVVLPTVS